MRSLYATHVGFILAYLSVICAYFHWVVLLALCPLFIVQSLYVKKLWRGELAFLQPRQWHFFNGQARLKQAQDWMAVDMVAQQVWPSCVIIQYKKCIEAPTQKKPRWQWDIIVYDACEAESFRQFIALMRSEYQGKEV
jgi:hypothetical protein